MSDPIERLLLEASTFARRSFCKYPRSIDAMWRRPTARVAREGFAR